MTSCNSNELEDNQLTKNKIDKLQYSECWWKFEVDSLGNIIDTIDITNKIIDIEGNLRFKKRLYQYDNKEYYSDTYYWKDGTDFLSIGESLSKDFRNYSEVKRTKNKELRKLITYSQFEDEIDTLIMDHKFDYSIFGRKKKLTLEVDSEEEHGVHIFNYNKDEKVQNELTIIESDTFERSEYFYNNKNLRRIEKYKHSLDTTSIVQFFGKNEKHDSTLTFSIKNGKQFLVSRRIYNYEEDSIYKGYEESNFKNDETKKVILQKKTCD